MSETLFLQPDDYYRRDLNPIRHYVDMNAHYLTRMCGISFEEAKAWVEREVRGSVVDPTVRFYERPDGADRSVNTMPLSEYIRSITKERLVCAPTFTCYANPYERPSKLAGYVDGNVKRRSISKKEAFRAKAQGDTLRYIMKDNEQNNYKTYNNSLSGTFNTPGSVLCNPTGHNSLTSTIRSVSSLGNASNERIVMGNRHYYSPEIVQYNLLSTLALIDRSKVEEALSRYSLHLPSVDEVMQVIEHSTRYYWSDPKAWIRLQALVQRMDDVERAAFVYTGDLYHIRLFNEGFTRSLIDALSAKVSASVDNALEVVKTLDEQTLNYAHQICFTEVKGLGKDYERMHALGVLDTLVATALHVEEVLQEYKPFIDAFFLTRLLPASHAYISTMIRRAVVVSDTDSTCFSVDDWMLWYFGNVTFDAKAFAVCGAIAFIANQCIAHTLSILSSNLGVRQEDLHALAMKNEYLWPVHLPMYISKHYAALTVMREGNVYSELELEMKGVHLKNSAAPEAVVSNAQKTIEDTLYEVYEKGEVDLTRVFRAMKDTEEAIRHSILKGETTYLKRSAIKEASSYKKGEDENLYQHYVLWCEVFSRRYGVIDPPPYSVVKIPTTLANKTALNAWIETIGGEMGEALRAWCVRYNKSALNTLYLPLDYVSSYGIPKEITPIIDINSIVEDLTITYRILLEALGVCVDGLDLKTVVD